MDISSVNMERISVSIVPTRKAMELNCRASLSALFKISQENLTGAIKVFGLCLSS